MTIIYTEYSLTIIVATLMAILAWRKKWFLLCYLLGLLPLFAAWLVAEYQVLEHCINCFEKGISSLAPEICCSLTNIELIPYTQIALFANMLYFVTFIGTTVIAQRSKLFLTESSKVIAPTQIASSLARATFFHAFIITCVGMVILILAMSINIRPFRSWETLGYAFWGVLPAITTFFVLTIYLRPCLILIESMSGNFRDNLTKFLKIASRFFFGVIIGFLSWLISYSCVLAFLFI